MLLKRNWQWTIFLTGMILGLVFIAAPAGAAADFESRKQEIVKRYEASLPTYSGDIYDEAPSTKYPYSIGRVNDRCLADGLKIFNFYRFLAGVPDDVILDGELTNRAQHGAVLLAVSGEFGHNPPRPSDMDDSFYEEGLASTTTSNISWGMPAYSLTIGKSLSGCMDDEDEHNIGTVGHRRWVLSNQLKKTAFGVADYGNNRYITNQVFDGSRSETIYPDYILWPNKSAFPRNVFAGNVPWSIQLNYNIFAEPNPQEVTVTLTRRSDGKTWTFTKNDTDKSGKYFNINNNKGYYIGSIMLPYCIIFRPDGVGSYDGAYDVSVSGLKSAGGSKATLDYTVEFFDIGTGGNGFDDNGDDNGTDNGENSGAGCNTGGASILGLIVIGALLFSKRPRRK
jgi:hypothetical protein